MSPYDEDPPSLLHDIRRREMLERRKARWARRGNIYPGVQTRKIRRFSTLYCGRSDVFREGGW